MNGSVMSLHWKQNLIIFCYLLLIAAQFVVAEDDAPPPNSEEEDDSSSEETVEDSNESRRRRSVEVPNGETASRVPEIKPPLGRAIPGLPDPATILKIAEILQAVGEKVVPILVEGNSPASLVTEHFSEDLMFLKNFKKEIDSFTEKLKTK